MKEKVQKTLPFLLLQRTVAPTPTFVPDDLTYKMRPDTAHVVGRDYARYMILDHTLYFLSLTNPRYEPSWSWSDFQRSSPAPELVHRPTYSRSVPLSSFMNEPRPYKPRLEGLLFHRLNGWFRSALWTPDSRENTSSFPKTNYRTWYEHKTTYLIKHHIQSSK